MRNKTLLYLITLSLRMTSSAVCAHLPSEAVTQHLQGLQSQLQLIDGDFSVEYTEQWMTVKFLSPDAKVLELGGNIGRNSCIIGALLNDSRNLVTVEPALPLAEILKTNRELNHLYFHIETAAISQGPLLFEDRDFSHLFLPYDTSVFLDTHLDLHSLPGKDPLPGYIRIPTLTFEELQQKYEISFDTLVADCEGALYYILKDDPSILKHIRLIITENDYRDANHVRYVTKLFKKQGFHLVYSNGPSVYGIAGFHQVWKKRG